jgi:hypothetical protein
MPFGMLGRLAKRRRTPVGSVQRSHLRSESPTARLSFLRVRPAPAGRQDDATVDGHKPPVGIVLAQPTPDWPGIARCLAPRAPLL